MPRLKYVLLAAAAASLALTAPASAWFAARGFGGGFRARRVRPIWSGRLARRRCRGLARGREWSAGTASAAMAAAYGIRAVPYAWPAGAVAAGLGGLAAGAAIGAAAAAYPVRHGHRRPARPAVR